MNCDDKKKRFFGLYNQTQIRLSSYLLAIVHNKTDAEDIMQETAIVLWDKFDEYRPGTNFGAWAINIANKKALEFMRKNKKSKLFFEEGFYESITHHACEDLTDDADRMEALQHCLDKVAGNGKKLLMMRYKKTIPVKRIAQMTGRSVNGLYQSFSKMVSGLKRKDRFLCVVAGHQQKNLFAMAGIGR